MRNTAKFLTLWAFGLFLLMTPGARPAALQAAAQRLHQRTQGEEPVAQIAYLEAAHVGASVALTGAQGTAVAARVKAVEHIFDAGQAITRLELEASAD